LMLVRQGRLVELSLKRAVHEEISKKEKVFNFDPSIKTLRARVGV